MRVRRGFSLVELLIVLSVGTAMLMVAMSVLYMLKETQVNVRRLLTEQRMITRLADQFREDVHTATGIERVSDDASSSDAATWQLTIKPDTVVRYELRDREVRRRRIIGDDASHDDYRLPAGVRATLGPPVRGSSITALRFEVTDATAPVARPIQIEAVLGLANRHTAQADRTAD